MLNKCIDVKCSVSDYYVISLITVAKIFNNSSSLFVFKVINTILSVHNS